MSNRFDYVKYNELSTVKQGEFKDKFKELENLVEQHLEHGRSKSLVITKLEEAYMWVGKAIRDMQPTNELEETRADS